MCEWSCRITYNFEGQTTMEAFRGLEYSSDFTAQANNETDTHRQCVVPSGSRSDTYNYCTFANVPIHIHNRSSGGPVKTHKTFLYEIWVSQR